jgi:hypothetical protein
MIENGKERRKEIRRRRITLEPEMVLRIIAANLFDTEKPNRDN